MQTITWNISISHCSDATDVCFRFMLILRNYSFSAQQCQPRILYSPSIFITEERQVATTFLWACSRWKLLLLMLFSHNRHIFSTDYSRLGRVPYRSPTEEPLGIAGATFFQATCFSCYPTSSVKALDYNSVLYVYLCVFWIVLWRPVFNVVASGWCEYVSFSGDHSGG